MRSLPAPTYDACSALELCANSIRDKDLARRLFSVADEIEAAETHYKEQGAKVSLFTIGESTTIAGRVSVKEMTTLYKGTFSRDGSKVRHVYDAIMAAPKYGRCPLCGHRDVSTLDHYLAQTKHPALTITPINLVPSCKDCNWLKLNRQPTCASEQTLHPYFDYIDDGVWLVARVNESSPPALVFSIDPPAIWDPVKRERVSTHFRLFELGSLYSSHAAGTLQDIHYNLMRLAVHSGAKGVRDYLMEEAESRQAVAKNSWQTALYKALGKSEWFCNDGYKLIAM